MTDRTPSRRPYRSSTTPVLLDRVVELFRPVPTGTVVDATLGGAGHAAPAPGAPGPPGPRTGPGSATHWPQRRPDSPPSASGPRQSMPASTSWRRGRRGRRRQPTDRRGPVRPRRQLPAARRRRAGLLLPPRRAARHADGPDAARWRRPTSSTATRGRAGRRHAPLRRRALRRPHRRGDRRRPARSSTTARAGRAIVRAPSPRRPAASGGHPAKRTFQAIRIEVNEELDVLCPAPSTPPSTRRRPAAGSP